MQHRHLGAQRLAVFLEDDVGVDAAEAEGVDAGAAWMLGAVDPRPCLVVDVERRAFQFQMRVRLVAQGRRQDLVMQRQRRLDHRRRAGRRQAVADHRLDGADGDGRQIAVARPEQGAQRLDLGKVAHRGAGAVRLDQADSGGIDAAALVGALQRQHLAFQARRQQALGLAVGGDADALDHGVDAVAVALGVVETLQHHHAHALAQQGAVGAFLERPDLAARQRLDLAELDVQLRRRLRVHAAGEHQVAAAGDQLLHRLVDRDQRRGAGGVDDVVRPHQVEAVGDHAGDDVGRQRPHHLAAVGRQLFLEIGAQLAQLGFAQVRPHPAHDVHGLVHEHAVKQHVGLAAVGIGAAAEHDAGALAVERRMQVAGIGQGIARMLQRQQVIGVAAVGHARHHAELGRIDFRQLAQEAAHGGVDAVVALRAIGHVEIGAGPFGAGLAHRIDLVEDVLPVGAQVARAGIAAGETDDGDVEGLAHANCLAMRAKPLAPLPQAGEGNAEVEARAGFMPWFTRSARRPAPCRRETGGSGPGSWCFRRRRSGSARCRRHQ